MQYDPQSFIKASEAISLIQAHTSEEPTVDIKFLAVNSEYIEKGRNFTIKLVEKRNGRVVEAGTTFARINTDREKYTIIDEIENAYERTQGIKLNLSERPTKEITSIVDPKTNASGRPMLDTSNDPMYTPNRDTRIG